MSLENTPIETPKTADIAKFIQNEYKSLTGVTTIPEGGTVWTLSWALAAIYILIYRFGTWAFNQIFFSRADSYYKKERGREYGLFQGTGLRAVLEGITGGGTPSALLPAGTLYQSVDNQGIYSVDSDAFVDPSGDLVAQVRANEVGADFTLSAGQQLTLVSPLAGIPTILFVTSVITDGEDPESDEAYFDRIDSRIKRPPQGGSPGDYFLWSTEVDGVIDVVLYEQVSGEIDVYPIVEGDNGIDRKPSASDIQRVEDSIESSGQFVYNDRRPIGADVNVDYIGLEEYRVEIEGFTSNGGTPTQEQAIYDEINNYLGGLRPTNPGLGKEGDTTEVNANIIFSIVNTITLAAGFTVDDVRTYFIPTSAPEEQVLPKRPLAPAKIVQFVSLTIIS